MRLWDTDEGGEIMALLVGRKAICARLGVSWGTVRNWIRQREFPVLQESGRQPILSTVAMEEWERSRRLAGKKKP